MRKLIISLAVAVGLIVAVAAPADAHAQPYDSSPGNEHNLCVLFNPLGGSSGVVYYHNRFTGPGGIDTRGCWGKYYSNGTCAYWEAKYTPAYGGWTGPHNVRSVSSAACPAWSEI
jgi:hypothetical protein